MNIQHGARFALTLCALAKLSILICFASFAVFLITLYCILNKTKNNYIEMRGFPFRSHLVQIYVPRVKPPG